MVLIPNRTTRFLTVPVNNGQFESMISWSQCSAVERVPGKLSGSWVFVNTRVPVESLFQNLEDGATITEYLEWFPGVTKKQVDEVLEFTSNSLLAAG